jgi:hypothetical protein
MKRLTMLIFLCLVLLPVAGYAVTDNYGYPIEGPYEATIIGTPPDLQPVYREKIRSRQLVLDVLPERKKPPIFFYDKGLQVTLAYQKKKAPLVFLIPGDGSNDRATKLLTMMRAFYKAGFHVITLPSPTNANFIISASRSCVPGDLTEDAADLYHAMEVAWNRVKDKIEVSSFNICGYSLGADEAAFVAKLDEERKVFNFRKVLMIDPPVSLFKSTQRIDDLLKKVPEGPQREGVFFNRMLSKFSEYYKYGNFVAVNDDFMYSMYKERLFSHEESGGLIGVVFRFNLAGMIFASDVMTNSGYVVPQNRVLGPTDPTFEYFLVATHLNYSKFFNEYFYPYFASKRPGLTKQELLDAQDLRRIESSLRSDKFGAFVNENDFVIAPEDQDFLRRVLGPRARFYARGGHLGNLEYKQNLADMVDFFKE